MSGRGELSSAIRITNVNDFLTPANACVLPIGGGAQPAPAGSVLSPIIPSHTSSSAATPLKATVTVSDCLACSGCVTSAETVLLSTENIDVLRDFVRRRSKSERLYNTHFAIAALSQQSVASIAAHFNLSLTATAKRISSFFKHILRFDAVFDNSIAVQISLLESATEFIQRWRQGKKLTITSACPGWLTYAEKTQESVVLDAISSVRSAQGIVGAIANYLPYSYDKRPTWVLSVAQCHDKKLEAIRSELTKPFGTEGRKREVDCVLTTGELIDVMSQYSFDLPSSKETPLDDAFQLPGVDKPFGVAVGSGSDGYAEYVLTRAARELLDIDVGPGDICFEKSSKSGDVRIATVRSADGSKQLRFATAYGFRSLQSILRKIRNGDCPYEYIELMACPGGCNNGGGQLPPPELKEDARSVKQQNADHLEAVHEKYFQAPSFEDPSKVPGVRSLYESLGGSVGSKMVKRNTRIKIQSRKEGTATSLDW